MGVLQARVLVLERGAAHAFGRDVLLVAFQASVGFGQPILEDPFEARLGVALLAAAALGVFEAAFAAAEAVVEEQTGEGQRGGDDGAAAEGVPEEVRVHGCSPSPPPRCDQVRCGSA